MIGLATIPSNTAAEMAWQKKSNSFLSSSMRSANRKRPAIASNFKENKSCHRSACSRNWQILLNEEGVGAGRTNG